MPKFHVLVLLSLTHSYANHLNSKHQRRAVIAGWLSHLIKDVGVSCSATHFKLSIPGC